MVDVSNEAITSIGSVVGVSLVGGIGWLIKYYLDIGAPARRVRDETLAQRKIEHIERLACLVSEVGDIMADDQGATVMKKRPFKDVYHDFDAEMARAQLYVAADTREQLTYFMQYLWAAIEHPTDYFDAPETKADLAKTYELLRRDLQS